MKEERAEGIIGLVRSFGTRYLNEELIACIIRLCIGPRNFLFDKENENFLTADVICDFFGTNKTTTANKATVIEKALNISVADKKFCTNEIVDSLSFVVTKGGFILPKKIVETKVNALVEEVIYEMADEEESREIEQFMAEKKKQEEEQAQKIGQQLKLW